MKILVHPTSSNLMWGIYGLTEKVGWEDLRLYDEIGRNIGTVCLNTKSYLRQGLKELKDDPQEGEFVLAIEAYLKDNKIHFWQYQNYHQEIHAKEASHISSLIQKDNDLISIDIWHPDEAIGVSTIINGIKMFAHKYLEIDNCQVKFENFENIEQSIKSFKEETTIFKKQNQIKIALSKELVTDLSILLHKSEEAILEDFTKAI